MDQTSFIQQLVIPTLQILVIVMVLPLGVGYLTLIERKVLGFMQFFDRAEQNILVKNQMFGWSRPGEFNELYDPDFFGNDFDGMYERLNDLRLRRL